MEKWMLGEKALLTEGARRMGKSTICEEFGKNEYESYIIHPRNLIVKDGIICIPHIWRWIYKNLTYTLDFKIIVIMIL